MGFRFDTEESAAILVHFGYNELRPTGFKGLLDINLSYNFSVGLRLMWSTGRYGDFNLDYNLSQNRFSVRNGMALSYQSVEQRARLYYSYDNILGLSFRLGGVAHTYVDADYIRNRNLFDMNDSYEGGYRLSSIALFASLDYDNRDDAYFPTKGISTGVEGYLRYLYDKPEMVEDINGDFYYPPTQFLYPPSKIVRAYIKPVVSIGPRFTILPSVGGRVVFDKNCDQFRPYYENMFGGVYDRRYVDHQFAFVGVNGPMLANDIMALARLDLRYRLGKNFFVSAIANVCYTNSFKSEGLFNMQQYNEEYNVQKTEFWIRGLGLEVAYKSMIGPISFDFMWNDITKSYNGYLNIGYFF